MNGKKIIKLSESDLHRIVKRVIIESEEEVGNISPSETSNGNLPDHTLDYVISPKGSKTDVKLNKDAAKDFNQMVIDAKEDGVEIKASQGYRELGTKERGCSDGFTQWCAWIKWGGNSKFAAKPGTSNHGWGSAVDVDNCRAGSPVHKWLTDNGKYYGFFPYAAEAWHWDWKPEKTDPPKKMDTLKPKEIPNKLRKLLDLDMKTLPSQEMGNLKDLPNELPYLDKKRKI